MDPAEARSELVRLVSSTVPVDPRGPREPFALDRAALLIAVDEYPDLDLEQYERQLDRLAERVEAAVRASHNPTDPRQRLAALRRVVFEEEGYHGNRHAYYDVRNSYLNEVLDRKLGIPISLATLLIGVTRRLSWPVEPVNFPAHFLLRYANGNELIPIDPFHGGLVLGVEELEERWHTATGTTPPPLEQMLAPAEPREVVLRLLNNIRLAHARERRYELSDLAAEKMLLIEPNLHHPE